MAGVSKASGVLGVRGMAAVVLMTMAAVVGARPAKVNDDTCSTSDTYVYPYVSVLCDYPAKLTKGYLYLSPEHSYLGLAPEYDETNATYYVRLATEAAEYAAVTEDLEYGTLLVNSTVFIYNYNTQRVLTWREEGTDEYFLIEQEVSSSEAAARFRLLQAESVSAKLPCPDTSPPAICQAYYLVSDGVGASSTSGPSDSGLETYEESSVLYIKAAASAGSTGNLPLVIISSSLYTSAMPFPTTRSVTARA